MWLKLSLLFKISQRHNLYFIRSSQYFRNQDYLLPGYLNALLELYLSAQLKYDIVLSGSRLHMRISGSWVQ